MNMEREIVDLYVDDIIPNRFQPREIFDDKALKELSISIKEHGVIQPIIVRKIGDKYEIIAGERRYKASVMAGLTKIPAIIRNLDDKESSKVALLENLQRRDLTAIEEARTYQKILDLDSMTQEELGRTMGKSQAAIANKLRLLALPDEVQEALLTGQISERHARSLLNVKNPQQQIEMLNKVINTKMTVRELDQEIKMVTGEVTPYQTEDDEEGTQKILPPPSFNEIPDMNPLSNTYEPVSNIDINTIRAQATDIINRPQDTFSMDQLLKVPADVTPVAAPEEKSFKFISPYEEEPEVPVTQPENDPFDFIANTPVSEVSQIPDSPVLPADSLGTNASPVMIDEIETLDDEKGMTPPISYQPFANTEALLNEFRHNNGQAPLPPVEPTPFVAPIPTTAPAATITDTAPMIMNEPIVPETKITDLKTVINTVRDMVRKLEDNGFVIDLDEIDFENTYQITMKIDKNK